MGKVRWIVAFGIAVIAVLACGAPVGAADEKHEPKYRYHDVNHKAGTLDARKKEDKEALVKGIEEGTFEHLELDTGMPNPLRFAVDLGIWAVVVFLFLVIILRKMAWGPMIEGLQKREATILGAVEEAKHARAETERVTVEFKAKMEAAYAEIPKLLEQARKDANALSEERKKKSDADIAADRQRLRNEIDTATDQALRQLQEHAANLATLISAKVLKREVSQDDHRRLVDEAINDMVQIAKDRRELG